MRGQVWKSQNETRTIIITIDRPRKEGKNHCREGVTHGISIRSSFLFPQFDTPSLSPALSAMTRARMHACTYEKKKGFVHKWIFFFYLRFFYSSLSPTYTFNLFVSRFFSYFDDTITSSQFFARALSVNKIYKLITGGGGGL